MDTRETKTQKENGITREQLKKLQVLYGQYEQTEFIVDDRRAARLAWASQLTGRPIATFSELTKAEAKQAIDHLNATLGLKQPGRRMSREQARRAALDGRRDGQEFTQAPQLANAADLEAIENLYLRLGWNREQFDAWLRSPRSPLGRRSNPVVSTAAQANKVRWGLQSLLKKKGLWEERA